MDTSDDNVLETANRNLNLDQYARAEAGKTGNKNDWHTAQDSTFIPIAPAFVAEAHKSKAEKNRAEGAENLLKLITQTSPSEPVDYKFGMTCCRSPKAFGEEREKEARKGVHNTNLILKMNSPEHYILQGTPTPRSITISSNVLDWSTKRDFEKQLGWALGLHKVYMFLLHTKLKFSDGTEIYLDADIQFSAIYDQIKQTHHDGQTIKVTYNTQVDWDVHAEGDIIEPTEVTVPPARQHATIENGAIVRLVQEKPVPQGIVQDGQIDAALEAQASKEKTCQALLVTFDPLRPGLHAFKYLSVVSKGLDAQALMKWLGNGKAKDSFSTFEGIAAQIRDDVENIPGLRHVKFTDMPTDPMQNFLTKKAMNASSTMRHKDAAARDTDRDTGNLATDRSPKATEEEVYQNDNIENKAIQRVFDASMSIGGVPV